MRIARAALAALTLAPLASAEYYLVPDSITQNIMLIDSHTGRVLSEEYFNYNALGGANLVLEANQVGDEIWTVSRFARNLHRFSVAGDAFITTIETNFTSPIRGPRGFAVVGSTVYLPCLQVLEHGVSASWVSRFSFTGGALGLFDLPDDSTASDLARNSTLDTMLSSNLTDDSVDVVTTDGALLQRIPSAGGNQAQVVRLFSGEIANATNEGVHIYTDGGAFVETLLAGVFTQGVAELETGELLVTSLDGIMAVDRATGDVRIIHETTGGQYIGVTTDPFLCPADVTADNVVNSADIATTLASWGTDGAGDITGDGVTNAADLAILLAAWGECR